MRRSTVSAGHSAIGAADVRRGPRTVPRPDRGVGTAGQGLGHRRSRGGARAGPGPGRRAGGRAMSGPLHGIPIGVKDIIDVAGLPTAAGFRPWSGQVAANDAGIVASLRTAGAVILGQDGDDPIRLDRSARRRGTHGTSNGRPEVRRAARRPRSPAGCASARSAPRRGARSSARRRSAGSPGSSPRSTGRSDGIVPFAPSLDHPGPIARSVARPRPDLHGILPPGRGGDSAVVRLR